MNDFDLTYNIKMRVEEDLENFIFETIQPFCESITQTIVTKQDLIDAIKSKQKVDKIDYIVKDGCNRPSEDVLKDIKKVLKDG